MNFWEWYDKDSGPFESLLKIVLGFLGAFFIFALPFALLSLIFDGISSACTGAYNWSRLQLCYLTKRCVAVEFLGKKYPAKTTSEIDYKIVDYYNGKAAVFNVESKVVHMDENCKAARLCTDNCIYMPEKVAKMLVKDKIARDCKYEFYTIKDCERTCGGVPSYWEYYCVDECASDTYDDKQFDIDEFLEEAKRGAYNEPDASYWY